MSIIEQRNVTIADRIIHLKDLKSLADYLAELKATEKENKYARLEIEAHCDDNSAFSGSSADIFLPESVISRKRVLRVSMSFRSSYSDKRVSIELMHNGNVYSNRVLVSGDDSRWVNGTITNITEILGAATPQSTFIRRYATWLTLLFSIGYGHLIIPVLNFIILNLISGASAAGHVQRSSVQMIIIGVINYAFMLVIGLTPASITISKLIDLWPSIELQIGPEHLDIERKRRTWLGIAFTGGVLPFILSAGYDLFRYFWK